MDSPQSPTPIALNPYAPTVSVARQDTADTVSRMEIGLRLGLAHTLAGTSALVAIVGTVLIAVLGEGRNSSDELFVTFASCVGLAAVLGVVVFGVVSAVTVPIFVVIFASRSYFGGDGWDRRKMANFARISGFLVGCVLFSLLWLANPEAGPEMILVGVVAGVVIGLLSPLFIRGLLRKVANLFPAG